MRAIWEPEAKTQRWLDVEIAVCEGLAHFGYIPQADVDKIKANARFELDRIAELEKETRHDVMAFVKNVQEHLGEEGRFLHFGITSYDAVDTALSLLLRDSIDLIVADAQALLAIIGRRALEHKDTLADRADARDSRGADYVRVQAGGLVRRVAARDRAPGAGAGSDRLRQDQRGGGDSRQYRAEGGGVGVRAVGAEARAGEHADLAAGPSCAGDVGVRDSGGELGEIRHRVAQLAADGNPGSAGVFRAGAAGIVGDAAQAQPVELGDGLRAGASGPGQHYPGAGGCDDVARARPRQFQRGADHLPRHLHPAGLDAAQVRQYLGHADRLPRQHAEKPRERWATWCRRSRSCSP